MKRQILRALGARSKKGSATRISNSQDILRRRRLGGLKSLFTVIATATMTLNVASAEAAPIIYNISLPSPSAWNLSGTITTNGTIGLLSFADITAYNLTATDGFNTSNCVSGICVLSGSGGSSSGFSGSTTKLTWDFGASPEPETYFNILNNSFICFGPSNGLCAFGNQGNVAAYSKNGVNTAQTYTGVQVLGSVAGIGAVPEPATWAMMVVGFGITGAALRRRKIKIAFA